jgi:2-hydroxy-3-keto-5-methylthiopentenyl-1-phosphate phosphatase
MKTKHKLAVFCDFDGTITEKDIGDELFKELGVFEPYHSHLIQGELDISDYWKILCKSLGKTAEYDYIYRYVDKYDVDSNFRMFAEFLREEEIPIKVVSDGFDVYIDSVLKRLELDWIPVHSNKMMFAAGKEPVPYFPLASESCVCKVASCKRNAVLNSCDHETIIVYIGDGISDFCAAEHSDIIFAKKKLAAHCNKYRIPHYPFTNFFDVYRIMKDIILQGKAKQRNQAFMLRNKAFETE